jgi:lipopolysaccharide transport system ATP-binding protein
VEQGEIVGIIGRNGAGKSTLLKVLSKITYPTSGSMKVIGRFASLLEVGTGFHDELTGRENIYLNGCIIGMTKKEIDTKFDDIVSFSDVEKFIDTPIKRYSSGMRLRLGFAVAANLDTDVLFVDEVLAVGDIGFQKKCLDKMGDLRTLGKSVVFVSHNMAAVENLCSRVIWVDDGRIREDGNPSDVIKSYMSTFSGITHSGMDLSHIESRHGNGDIRFTRIEFLDGGGNPLPIIRAGDSLTIRFHFLAHKPITNPSFGFRMFIEFGTLVNEFSTWAAGVDTSTVLPGPGFIDLDIDFLNLMPSRYHLSLWVTTQNAVPYDGLENCITMDVEVSDYYKSGKGIDRRYGIMFFPCRWNTTRQKNHV